MTWTFGPPGSGVDSPPDGGPDAPRSHAAAPAPEPSPAPAPAAPARERTAAVAQISVLGARGDPERLRRLGEALVAFMRAHPWVHSVSGLDDLLRGVEPARTPSKLLNGEPIAWSEQMLVFGRVPPPPGCGEVAPVRLLREALRDQPAYVDWLDPDGGV